MNPFETRVWELFLNEDFNSDNIYSRGANKQRERIWLVAEQCAKACPGDFVEIGAYHGETTVGLCRVAKRYGRRVIVIDPYELGTQNIDTGNEYQTFLNNTSEFRDLIDHYKMSSLDPHVIEMLKTRQLCFAFVDGLHTYEAAISDLQAVSHTKGIVALDDVTWSSGVNQAGREFASQTWRGLHVDGNREMYFIRSQ